MPRSFELTSRFVVILVAFSILAPPFLAQHKQEDFPTELPAEETALSRDFGNGIMTAAEAFKFRPAFRLKRVVAKPKRKRPPTAAVAKKYQLPAAADAGTAATWEKLGVTIWKAAAPPAPGSDAIALTTQSGGVVKEMVPVRVSSGTTFKRGDQVRISVESPRKGYLYILDREILGDDALGPPFQIFPTMLAQKGNNLVRPGTVIDVPSQLDGSPFFDMGSTTPGYRGELLTIIVSPVPLKDLGTPDVQAEVASDLVYELEQRYLADVGEYEQPDGEGKPYTRIEKAAGSDATRQLTQRDPYPQTMYRVKMRPTEPMVVNVTLAVK